MLVLHSFEVQTGSGVKKSPFLGTGDMTRLQKLFPNSPVWQGHTNSIGNIRYISVEQAEALYMAMVKHYAESGVSDEPFQTGNFTGSFAVVSDLQSTFDELIEFFEKTFKLTSSKEAKKAIGKKQQERKQREEQARAKYREKMLTFFEKLEVLKPPANAVILSKLNGKLDEYRRRLKLWEFRHPDMAFQVEPGFRDTTFKILVTEAILNSAEPVNLLDLFKKQLEKYEDLLDAGEFFRACVVISVHLGTPLPDGRIGEEAVTA